MAGLMTHRLGAFNPAAGGGGGGTITFVGSKVVTTTAADSAIAVSLTDLLDETGATATLLQDDFVIVTAMYGLGTSGSDVDYTAPGGWDERADLYQFDTQESALFCVTRHMGSTPDTTVTMPASGIAVGDAREAVITVHAFRDVSKTTPMDVSPVPATGFDSGRPDPATITPVTAGAFIYVAGGAAISRGNASAFTMPAGLSATTNHWKTAGVNGPSTGYNAAQGGAGIKTDWASGAFDCPAYTGGGSNSSACWTAITLALRPA